MIYSVSVGVHNRQQNCDQIDVLGTWLVMSFLKNEFYYAIAAIVALQ